MVVKELFFSNVWLIREGMPTCTFLCYLEIGDPLARGKCCWSFPKPRSCDQVQALVTFPCFSCVNHSFLLPQRSLHPCGFCMPSLHISDYFCVPNSISPALWYLLRLRERSAKGWLQSPQQKEPSGQAARSGLCHYCAGPAPDDSHKRCCSHLGWN